MRIDSLPMAAAKLLSISSLPSPRFRAFAAPQTVALHGFFTSAVERKRKKKAAVVKEKRRTRSDREFEIDDVQRYGDTTNHIPVMLGEVIDVFSSSKTPSLRSFVDCTVGAAGHASAIIQAHPELKYFIGMDVDPLACEKARARIDSLVHSDSRSPTDLKTYTILKNFRHIKSVLSEVDENLLDSGVDGILMDLGMSSMQVDNPERGFSILRNGPLDMRMDPQGLCCISKLSSDWLAKAEEAFKVGKCIDVKLIEVNEKGQLRLSRRSLLPETSMDNSSSEETSDEGLPKKVVTVVKGKMEEKSERVKAEVGTTKARSSNKSSSSENTLLPQKKFIRKPVASGKDRLDTIKEKARNSGSKPVSISSKVEKSLPNKEANVG